MFEKLGYIENNDREDCNNFSFSSNNLYIIGNYPNLKEIEIKNPGNVRKIILNCTLNHRIKIIGNLNSLTISKNIINNWKSSVPIFQNKQK